MCAYYGDLRREQDAPVPSPVCRGTPVPSDSCSLTPYEIDHPTYGGTELDVSDVLPFEAGFGVASSVTRAVSDLVATFSASAFVNQYSDGGRPALPEGRGVAPQILESFSFLVIKRCLVS